ncbi:MAG: DNA-3-methyladenine glycosylase I [Candidatus Aquicultor sp.]
MADDNICPFVKPKEHLSDDEYFVALSCEIFRMIIGTEPVIKRWQEITRAFDDFSIEKVSEFSESNVERLLSNTGIIRNRKKIEATILNARAFKKIQQEYGSFKSYAKSFKGDTDRLIADLDERIHYIGASSIRRFLNGVGINAGQKAA